MIAAGDGSEQTASLVIFMFLSTKCDSDIFFSCFYGKMYKYRDCGNCPAMEQSVTSLGI